jgi:hypothetical protein|tara:strand:- start:337 stop:546 length:210 start_codon:yes stop_codon:yes gene_type:complete
MNNVRTQHLPQCYLSPGSGIGHMLMMAAVPLLSPVDLSLDHNSQRQSQMMRKISNVAVLVSHCEAFYQA